MGIKIEPAAQVPKEIASPAIRLGTKRTGSMWARANKAAEAKIAHFSSLKPARSLGDLRNALSTNPLKSVSSQKAGSAAEAINR